jgi:stalled ribosome alternative rescue factor ArfA
MENKIMIMVHGEMRVSSLTDLILQKLTRVKQSKTQKGKTIVSEGIDANYQGHDQLFHFRFNINGFR